MDGIIVKSTIATKTSSSIIDGKRIFICGTTDDKGLFFAIFNSVYNLTEYVYEDPSEIEESCKDIHIDTSTGHLLVVTQRPNGVYLRGFSLERI